ncbi:MAG: thioredoxin domain-containing protein [Desulfuromonadales bacterium]|nr:thioredoxin domain-containing protein [Desulfuromonadales bacterium]
MTRYAFLLLLFGWLMAAPAQAAGLKIERQELPLTETPRQVAYAADGDRIFVLSSTGKVVVYAAEGRLLGDFFAGDNVTSIAAAPDGDRLFVGRADKPVLELIELSFPQEIDITGAPIRGAAEAPVTVTVFSEFQCPYCASVQSVLDQALTAFPGKVKLAFKHYPLQRHPLARPAALATVAAQRQGRFWELHDLLFSHQQELDTDTIRELAIKAELDMTAFDSCLQDPETVRKVNQDHADGVAAGVRGTPTIFVNGQLLKNRSPAALNDLITQQLGATGRPPREEK